jgi:hypothetical protein
MINLPKSLLVCLILWLASCRYSSLMAQNFVYLESKVIADRVKPSLKGEYIDLVTSLTTPTGDYFVAGTVYNDSLKTEGNYWMAISDSTGKILWKKTLNAIGDDKLETALITDDGGYLLGGSSNSPTGKDKSSENFGLLDYWLVKISHIGEIEWQRSLGGTKDDELISLIATNTGFSVGGWSNSSQSGNTTMLPDSIAKLYGFGYAGFWVVELDAKGNITSEKDLDHKLYCTMSQLYYMQDGGFLLIGQKHQSEFVCENTTDWMIRLDNQGKIQWTKNYAELPYSFRYCNIFTEAENGHFYIGGTIDGNNYKNSDYVVLCFTPNGDLAWHKVYGGEGDDRLYCISISNPHELLLGGTTKSDKSGQKTTNTPGSNFDDIWVLHINEQGDILKQTALGGYENEKLAQLIPLKDGSVFVAGSSNSDSSYSKTQNCFGDDDYWVVKYDSFNKIEWGKTLGGVKKDELIFAEPTQDGGFLLAGESQSNASGNKSSPSIGFTDAWLVKLDGKGQTMWQKNLGDSATEIYLKFLAENKLGEIYVVFESYMSYGYRAIKMSGNGEVLHEFEIDRHAFLHCVPGFGRVTRMLALGNNEIVIKVAAYPSNYGPFRFNNPEVICRILDVCIKNLKRLENTNGIK